MYTKSLIVDEGDRLLENWGSQISNVEKGIGPMDYQRKIVLSRILESANQHIGRARQVAQQGILNEATQVGDTSFFNKMYINVLSAAIPNIIAQDIVSVQPLDDGACSRNAA